MTLATWTPVEQLIDHGRTDWYPDGYRVSGPERAPSDIVGIEIHHAAASRGTDQSTAAFFRLLTAIFRYHVFSRRWRDVFYNVFVDPLTGRTAAGRHLAVPSQSNLRGWLTVNLAGHLDHEDISHAAAETVAALYYAVGGQIRMHQERDATGCPGDAGERLVEQIRAGEFAYLQERPINVSGSPFGDPNAEAEFQAAVEAGFISATNRDEPITREQVAVVAWRAYGAASTETGKLAALVNELIARVEQLEARPDAADRPVNVSLTLKAEGE